MLSFYSEGRIAVKWKLSNAMTPRRILFRVVASVQRIVLQFFFSFELFVKPGTCTFLPPSIAPTMTPTVYEHEVRTQQRNPPFIFVFVAINNGISPFLFRSLAIYRRPLHRFLFVFVDGWRFYYYFSTFLLCELKRKGDETVSVGMTLLV